MQVLLDKHRIRLVDGARNSTKTVACLHDICLHLWEEDGAHAVMCGKTITDNADGGAWSELRDVILPKWQAGGFGMDFRWPDRQKMDHGTHKYLIDVRNKHGTWSRVQLDSVKDERDLEHKFKGKTYSFIYIPELSNFPSRKCFQIWEETIRGRPNIPKSRCRFLADTNPPEDGEDSWIYRLFYLFRNANLDGKEVPEWLVDEMNLGGSENMKLLQKDMSVHRFTVEDNQWMNAEEKAKQRAKYAYDPILFKRYFLGQYVRGSSGGLFYDVLRPNIHVVSEGHPLDPQVLLPEENCGELGTAWDTGGMNNAVFVIEPVTLYNEAVKAELVHFKVLDEIVEVDRHMVTDELVENVIEKMDFWEKLAGKPFWIHIGDRAMFETHSNRSEQFESEEIFAVSNGRIDMTPGPVKKHGTVARRVNLLRKMLSQDRITVCGARCPELVKALQSVQRGKLNAIDAKSQWKHHIDALTYYIAFKCYAEFEENARKITVPSSQATSVVSLGF